MNRKRLLVIVVAVTVFTFLIWFMFNRFGKTKVTIETEDGGQIKLAEFNEELQRFVYRQVGETKTTIYLDSGEYDVRVSKNESETEGSIVVNEEELEQFIPLKNPGTKNQLMYGVAYDLIKSVDSFRFYDPRFDMIFTLKEGSKRPERLFLPIDDIEDVVWLNYNNAFIKTSRDYYVFNQGNVKKLPFAGRNTEGDERLVDYGYDKNSKNDFVININGSVFLYKDNFNTRKRVATDKKGLEPEVSDSGDVLLYTGQLSNVEESPDSETILLKSPNYSGREVSLSNPITLEWSSQPGLVTLTTSDGVTINDLNNNNEYRVLSQPLSNPSALIWKNDDTLLYFHDQTIWAYNIGEKFSYKVLDTGEDIGHRNPFYLKDDTLYYSSTATGDSVKDINLYSVDVSDF